MQIAASLTANYSARMVSATLSLVFVPLYINLLGIEAFGLIGLHTSLIVWSTLLHFGLGHSALREFARYTGGAYSSQQIRDLSWSIEVAFGVILVFIGCLGYGLLVLSGSDWFRTSALDPASVQLSLQMMLAALLLRLLAVLYRSALVGLQRQVQANSADIVFSLLRYGLTLAALLLYRADIEIYFCCQVLISLAEALAYRVLLARAVPVSPGKPRCSFTALRSIWRYSAGAALTSALTISLSQIDKLVLLPLLSLEQFGYYSIAFVVTSALGLLATPVMLALQPRFAQLYAADDLPTLKATYTYGCRILILVVVPAALVLSIFSEQFLRVWQQSESTIAVAAPLMSLLMLAQMSLMLSNLNQALQLAYGWTRLLIYAQTTAILALLPLLYWSATRWGAPGAASAVLAVNAIYFVCLNYLGHRRLLPELRLRWLSHYLAPTLLALTLLALLVEQGFAAAPANLAFSLFQLLLASTLCLALGFALSGELRPLLWATLRITSNKLLGQVSRKSKL